MANANLVKQKFSWAHALFDKIFFFFLATGWNLLRRNIKTEEKPCISWYSVHCLKNKQTASHPCFLLVWQEGHIMIYTITGAGYSQKSLSNFFSTAYMSQHESISEILRSFQRNEILLLILHNNQKDKANYIFFRVFLQDSRTVTSVTKSKISVRKKFPGAGL